MVDSDNLDNKDKGDRVLIPLRCPIHGKILAEISQYTSGEVYKTCPKCPKQKRKIEFKVILTITSEGDNVKRDIVATYV